MSSQSSAAPTSHDVDGTSGPGGEQQPAGDPAVRWRLLGPLEGRAADGRLLDLGPPTRRSLLALLLAYAGQQVSMPAVVDALWGDDPPDRAVNIVHRHVGALRRLVEPGLPRRAPGSWLLPSANGYRVVVSSRTLDLLEFRELAAAARDEADPGRRLDRLGRALALWHGRAAEDVEVDGGRHPAFVALDREQAELAVAAAEQAIPLGRADEALAPLEQAARANPTDELVHAELVRCLAAAGRRAQALDTYGGMREYLVEELGLSPGPALQRAQLEVLRDETPATGVPDLPRPAELPPEPAVFVGRDAELARLRGALAGDGSSRPPVVVTGTAGVGKTSLAIRLAHEIADGFPDGQLYVNLRGFDPDPRAAVSPDAVLSRFLEALDVARARIPSDPEARAALYRSTLASRRLLIVLDNARDTAQVRPLLPGNCGCQVVVTSRVQLRGLVREGAHAVPLGLLDATDSRAYVTKRVGAARVEAEPDAVDALHRMSDGLPIALSLLTARAALTPGASLAAVVEEVGRSRGALEPFVDTSDPASDLRAVFSWSYDALTPPAARLFRLLALHPPPPVPVPAAAALAGRPDAEVRGLLEQLAEANLATETVPGRYGRHDLLERYAESLLAGDRDEAAAQDRMYAFYTRLAGAADAAMSPGRVALPDLRLKPEEGDQGFADEDEAAAWFEREHAVLLALTLGDGPGSTLPSGQPGGELDPYVWRLAWALQYPLDKSGRWEDLRTSQEAGLAAARRSAGPAVEAAMRQGLARGYVRAGLLDAGEQQARDALRLLYEVDPGAGSPAFTADVHGRLGWIHEKQGRIEDALAQNRLSLGLHDPASRTSARAGALNGVGYMAALLGRDDEALENCLAAIEILEEVGSRADLANAWSSVAYVYEHRGQYAAAVHGFRLALEFFRADGFRFPTASMALELARTLVAAGHPALARPLLTEAAATFDDLGHERADVARRRLAELDETP